jgi:hypothetical protein
MLLETDRDSPQAEPTDEAVASALERLGRGELRWVALSADAERSRLLAAERGKRGFVLERAEGRLWRSRGEIAFEAVRAAMADWRRGGADWQQAAAWRDATMDHVWVYAVLLAAIGVTLLLVIRLAVAVVRDAAWVGAQ